LVGDALFTQSQRRHLEFQLYLLNTRPHPELAVPLKFGAGRKVIGENIAAEEEAGKPPAQAEAIALDKARESGADIPEKEAK
jgi:hypothetical protein